MICRSARRRATWTSRRASPSAPWCVCRQSARSFRRRASIRNAHPVKMVLAAGPQGPTFIPGSHEKGPSFFLPGSIFPYKTTSLPRLVTPAKVPDIAVQLQGMFGTPWGFVTAKIKFVTVGSRRNGHSQIQPFQECGCSAGMSCTDNLVDPQHGSSSAGGEGVEKGENG
jgi:hypothetical protein